MRRAALDGPTVGGNFSGQKQLGPEADMVGMQCRSIKRQTRQGMGD